MTLQERNQLIDALIEGDLSESDFVRLEAELTVDPAAREEYYRRLALTALIEAEADAQSNTANGTVPRLQPFRSRMPKLAALAAAGVALMAAGWWGLRQPADTLGTTSQAVAMLDRVVDAAWAEGGAGPRLGAPLEPGLLKLESGFAQVVFYSGARVVLEGPAELQIISPNEASCPRGRLVVEVPPEARGFRVRTPQMRVTDPGTSFGLEAGDRQTELHVFKGSVEFEPSTGAAKELLREGTGAVIENSQPTRFTTANPAAFTALFDLKSKSLAAEALRFDQWRVSSDRVNQDPSLLVQFDFERRQPSDWRLHNASTRSGASTDATIVGCQWVEGRWTAKSALEFRNVNDRIRMTVPGEFESLTLASWVRVQGLDRKINSLFMSDGFKPGTIHWVIRNDGALGLTVIGSGTSDYQIVDTSPVITMDRLGMWLHLAVVLDGHTGRVTQYVNGHKVGAKPLKINPPFQIAAAELGNWNSSGYSGKNPFLIRNFSGSMDEFCLFARALNGDEILALFSAGKPHLDSIAELKTH